MQSAAKCYELLFARHHLYRCSTWKTSSAVQTPIRRDEPMSGRSSALWKHSQQHHPTLHTTTMLLTMTFTLLTFTLLAHAAPAAPPHPAPTPAATSDTQSGALSSLFSGAPDDEAVRQAACGKHGCKGFKKDRRDVAALDDAGFDGGSGSFDLAPELTDPIEGLRQQDDGHFFNAPLPEAASSGEVSTTGVLAPGDVFPAVF